MYKVTILLNGNTIELECLAEHEVHDITNWYSSGLSNIKSFIYNESKIYIKKKGIQLIKVELMY